MSKGIYMLINDITSEVYVGQSMNLEKRKQYHFRELANGTHHNSGLQADYNSGDTFTFHVIEYANGATRSELWKKEEYYINLHDSYYHGYNNTRGGSYDGLRYESRYGGRKSTYHNTINRPTTYHSSAYDDFKNSDFWKVCCIIMWSGLLIFILVIAFAR